MVSHVVSKVLSKILGDYVEGLDDRVKVSITSGDLSLGNLKLKQSALQSLELPVHIREGAIGTLSVKIPWQHLGTKPVVVRIQQLFVLISPIQETKAVDQQNLKIQRLLFDEMINNEDGDEEGKDKGYLENLIIKITDNLQIYIDDLHVRYEDSLSNPRNPTAIGITLGHLHIQSTDDKWQPTFLTVGTSIIHKLLTMSNLSVYMNYGKEFLQYHNFADFQHQMTRLIPKDKAPQDHYYILRPASAEIKANINKNKVDFSRPGVIVDLLLENIEINVDNHQFHGLIDLAQWYTSYFNKLEYSKNNPPAVSIKEDPMEWWKFSISAKIKDIKQNHEQWNWNIIKSRIADRVQYVKLYKIQKIGGHDKMSSEHKNILNEIEKKYNYEDLSNWRKLAQASLKLDKQKGLVKPKTFFTTLFGSEPKEQEITQAAWKELYQVIGFEEDKGGIQPKFPPEYDKISINFMTKHNIYTLIDKDRKEIASAVFSGLEANIKLKDTCTEVAAKLQTLYVSDYTHSSGKERHVVSPDLEAIKYSVSSKMPTSIIDVRVAVKPIDSKADLQIALSSQPLIVFCSLSMVTAIQNFFKTEENPFGNVAQNYNYAIDTLREQAALSAKYALQSKSIVAMEMNLSNCIVIIPQSFETTDCDTLVVDLGSFNLQTDLAEQETIRSKVSESDITTQFSEDDFYSSYILNVRGINSYLTKDSKNWRQKSDDRSLYLIPKFDTNLRLKTRSDLGAATAALPLIKLSGTIDELSVNIQSSWVGSLLSISNSVVAQLPPPEKPVPLPDTNIPTAVVTDQKFLEFSFNMKHFYGGFVSVASSGKSKKLFAIDLKELHASGNVEKDQTEIETRLKSFELLDLISSKETQTKDYFIKADNPQKDVFSVKVSFIPPTSPKFNGVEMNIITQVGQVDLIMNRSTLVFLINYMLELVQQITNTIENTQPKTEPQKQLVAPKSFESLKDFQLSVIDENLKNTKSHIVAHVHLHAELFSLTLIEESKPIFYSTLSHTRVTVESFNDGVVQVKGKLGRLSAKDTFNTKWSTMIKIEDTQDFVATFKFIIYPEEHPQSPGYTNIISLKTEKLYFVFTNQNVMALVNYFNGFNQMNQLGAMKFLGGNQSNAPPPKIDIKLSTITLMIPRNEKSEEYFILSLDNTSVTNQHIKNHSNIPIEQWNVHLSVLTGSSVGISNYETYNLELLRLPSIEIRAAMAINPKESPMFPDVLLNMNASEILLNTNGDQLLLLCSTLHENIMATSAALSNSDMKRFKENLSLLKSSTLGDSAESQSANQVIRPTLQLEFSVNKLVWNLNKGKQMTESTKAALNEIETLVAFKMVGFSTKLTQRTDNSMDLNLTVTDITITDHDEKTLFSINRTHNISAPLRRSKTRQQHTELSNTDTIINLDYRANSNLARIELTIEQPRLLPTPDFLTFFNKAFVGPYMFEIMTKISHLTEATSSTNEPSKPSPENIQHMIMDISMRSPQIIILQKFDVDQTKAFIINLGDWLIRYDTKPQLNLDIKLMNIDIHSAIYDEKSGHKKAVQIIQNLNFNSIVKERAAGSTDLIIDLTISPINIILSYGNVVQALKSYKRWETFINSVNNTNYGPKQDKSQKQLQSKSQPPAVVPNHSFNVSVESLSLLFLNDKLSKGAHIPLCRAFSYEIAASVTTGVSTSMNLELNHLAIENLNDDAGEWESLLERWSVAVIYKMKDDLFNVEIQSQGDLFINIPPSFIRSVCYVGALMKEEYYQVIGNNTKDVTKSRAKHGVVIFNDCGKMLVYRVDSGEDQILMPDQKLPVEISNQNDTISLRIDEPGFDYKRIKNIKWNKVGITIFRGISDEDPTELLVVEVKNILRGYTLVVRSDESIYNGTGSPIQLSIKGKLDPAQQLNYTLEHGQSRSIPLNWTGGLCDIFVQPSKDHEVISLDQNKAGLIANPTAKGNHPKWSALLYKNEQLHSGFLDYRVDLLPLLIIENCFANKLMFRTRTGSGESKVYDIANHSEEFIMNPASLELKELFLSFKLPGFEWSEYISIAKILDEESYNINLTDSKKEIITLNITLHQRHNNVIHISAFVPYWIINHTPYNLVYGGNKSVGGHVPLDPSSKVYYDPEFGTKNIAYFSDNELYVKLQGVQMEWSKAYKLNAQNIGTTELVTKNERYNLAVTVKIGPEKFCRSSIVRIYPAYILINNSNRPIIFTQFSDKSSKPQFLSPQSQVPITWTNPNLPSLISLSLTENGFNPQFTGWTEGIDPQALGLYQFKLKDRDEVVNIEIKIVDGIKYIVVGEIEHSDKISPYFKLRNNTEFTAVLSEKDKHIRIAPKSEGNWLWQNPQQSEKILKLKFLLDGKESKEKSINFHQIKHTNISTPQGEVRIQVTAEGVCRVIDCSIRSSKTKSEELDEKSNTISLSIPSIGISLIDHTPQELLYIYIGKPFVFVKSSPVAWSLHFIIQEFQVDNQLLTTPYPIFVYPPKVEHHSFLNIEIVKDIRFSTVDCYRLFSLCLQEMEIAIDKGLLLRILDWWSYVSTMLTKLTGNTNTVKLLEGETFPLTQINPKIIQTTSLVYFQTFQIWSLWVKLTFSVISNEDPKRQMWEDTSLDLFRKVVSFIPAVSGVPLRIEGLLWVDLFTRQDQLMNLLMSHYTSSFFKQFFLLLGSAEIIGSPVDLFVNIGSGFKSFVDEPRKAIQTSDPKAIGLGMAKGTGKLIGKTIFTSVFGAASKITGTISSAAAHATLDDQYLKQRNLSAAHKPKHVGDGIAKGFKSFGTNLVDGLTGVVRQPMKGAEEGGVKGFAEGLGKGLLGLAVKPVVGAVDLVALSAQGVSNTTSYFENKDRDRRRLPRFFDERKLVLSYDELKARGLKLMYKAPDDSVKNKIYHFHTPVKDDNKKAYAILSNDTFYYIAKPLININITNASKYVIKHQFEYSYLRDVKLNGPNLSIEYYNHKLGITKVNLHGNAEELKSFHNKLVHLYYHTCLGTFSYEAPHTKPDPKAIKEHRMMRGLDTPYRLAKKGNLNINRHQHLASVAQGTFSFTREKKPETMSLAGSSIAIVQNDQSYLLLTDKNILSITADSLKLRQDWIDVSLLNGAKIKKLNVNL